MISSDVRYRFVIDAATLKLPALAEVRQSGQPFALVVREKDDQAVFGGMLVSTVVNLVFIPGLYVLMQKLRGESKRSRDEEREEEELSATHSP